MKSPSPAVPVPDSVLYCQQLASWLYLMVAVVPQPERTSAGLAAHRSSRVLASVFMTILPLFGSVDVFVADRFLLGAVVRAQSISPGRLPIPERSGAGRRSPS